MNTSMQTFRQVILKNRRPGESRLAQANRLGLVEGSLRQYEAGALPRPNFVGLLAPRLGVDEARLRLIVAAGRKAGR